MDFFFDVKHYAISFVDRKSERKETVEWEAMRKGSEKVIVYTLLKSFFYCCSFNIKINFSVRTRVLVEMVPVGHVTHTKQGQNANRFGHKLWEAGNKSIFFANKWKHICDIFFLINRFHSAFFFCSLCSAKRWLNTFQFWEWVFFTLNCHQITEKYLSTDETDQSKINVTYNGTNETS